MQRQWLLFVLITRIKTEPDNSDPGHQLKK
jgi:hypothetical protein